MARDREEIRCRLALAFVDEAVSLTLGSRPWADRMNESELRRYVTESDLRLRDIIERRRQQASQRAAAPAARV